MKSKILIRTGLLLLAAAFFIAGYNIWDESRALREKERVLSQMEFGTAEFKKLYEIYPDMEMPEFEIDGQIYIGKLSIPDLNLELPVLSEWDERSLKTAPCRYAGSAYQNNMILAAHNYRCHFGNLDTISLGTSITFIDAWGNAFKYEASDIEILPDTAVEEMQAGEWDLTLFTCTYSGRDRVTVRCVLQEK